MFGITPLGWVHTLGSLPAVPAAAYMLIRYGRIIPHSTAGRIYFISMLIGSLTVFLVAKSPAIATVGAITLLVLLAGYTVGKITRLGRIRWYLETFLLSFTVLLLAVPTVSETLRRVPDGHPIAADPSSPILQGALAGLLAMFVIGVAAQFTYLFKFKRSRTAL